MELNREDREWIEFISKLPDASRSDISMTEAERRLAAAEPSAEPFDTDRIEALVASVPKGRRRPQRAWLRWVAALFGLVLLVSAGVATVIWPSNTRSTVRLDFPGALELMADGDTTTYRRGIAIAAVAQFGLRGFKNSNRFIRLEDPDLLDLAREQLEYLNNVWEGRLEPSPDLSMDFNEASKIARGSGPRTERCAAFRVMTSQAAYALHQLRKLEVSDPELVNIHEQRILMIRVYKDR